MYLIYVVESSPLNNYLACGNAELEFDKRVVPKTIHIYETYHPGAVVKILACNADPKDKTTKRSGEVEYVFKD